MSLNYNLNKEGFQKKSKIINECIESQTVIIILLILLHLQRVC